jgi:DNA polymerase type B, organellar and viral
LHRLYERNVKLSVVSTGLKIYRMELKAQSQRNILFIDSINFFAQPLSSLPGTFGLNVDSKGYFPHFYNVARNMSRRLSHLPAKRYYGFNDMMPRERTAFIQWYREHKHQPFHLRGSLLEYCRQDVRILRAACLKFKQLFEESVRINPLAVSSTIAKLALYTYRARFLSRRTMINCPETGYLGYENQSTIALKYMRLLAKKNRCSIRTREWAMGEARIGDSGLRVDGLLVKRSGTFSKTCVEFLGCYWHGRLL